MSWQASFGGTTQRSIYSTDLKNNPILMHRFQNTTGRIDSFSNKIVKRILIKLGQPLRSCQPLSATRVSLSNSSRNPQGMSENFSIFPKYWIFTFPSRAVPIAVVWECKVGGRMSRQTTNTVPGHGCFMTQVVFFIFYETKKQRVIAV